MRFPTRRERILVPSRIISRPVENCFPCRREFAPDGTRICSRPARVGTAGVAPAIGVVFPGVSLSLPRGLAA